MFLKLLTAKGPFRDQEHIKAWLIRVTLHEAVNLHRQFWHRKVGLLGESPFPPEAVAPESGAWEVLETLRTLPGHQRDVLYLHCVEGYSVEETATILGLRPGTVKSRLSRARAALREAITGGTPMNLQDLNQITTPKEWKQRALSLGDPAPARHPKAKKKLVLAFVVLLCLVLGGGTVLATEIVQHFQNPRVVQDTAALEQEIAAHAKRGYALYGSGGPNPISQDEVIHFSRTHSSTWTRDAYLDEDAIPLSSVDWISSTVDCAEGPLWERHAYNAKGHVRAEATAETPLLLLDRQTPYATWDLDWMEAHYDSVPYGNRAYTTTDQDGNFLGTFFETLYLSGEDAYVDLTYFYSIDHTEPFPAYYIEEEFDQIEEYTTSTGVACLLSQSGNVINARAETAHYTFYLYAGNLTFDEAKEILEHLQLQVDTAPAFCSQE